MIFINTSCQFSDESLDDWHRDIRMTKRKIDYREDNRLSYIRNYKGIDREDR